MKNIQSRKLLNALDEMDCAQRENLLRINTYKHPLSKLKTSKATLLELKSKLECSERKENNRTPRIRHILEKKRSN
ncbi:hypothetical protein JT359_16850 [Candidatus Poribacteria bacterium]|nr:hypothetical protein [Candidatus Poribacteria bacterium]